MKFDYMDSLITLSTIDILITYTESDQQYLSHTDHILITYTESDQQYLSHTDHILIIYEVISSDY